MILNDDEWILIWVEDEYSNIEMNYIAQKCIAFSILRNGMMWSTGQMRSHNNRHIISKPGRLTNTLWLNHAQFPNVS